MPSGKPIDRDALHRTLRAKANRDGVLRTKLLDLAPELGLGYCNLTVVFKEMIDSGRIRVVSGAKNRQKTYFVSNPDEYKVEN